MRSGLVGVEGFEPPTSSSQSWRSTRLSYTPPETHLTERLRAPRKARNSSPASTQRQRDTRAAAAGEGCNADPRARVADQRAVLRCYRAADGRPDIRACTAAGSRPPARGATPVNRCPLCTAGTTEPLPAVHGRSYAHCTACGLDFMARADLPDRATERALYDLHRNDPADARYRDFLDRLALPLAQRLTPGDQGLDYGCGPQPVLASMLTERGFPTVGYDPLFAPDARVLGRRYDFIACTEAAEHFHDPAAEFTRIAALLEPGGWLGVMTQWRDPGADFSRWRYVHDPTHVCFYRQDTLRWIAARHGWDLQLPARNIALFRAPGGPRQATG